MTLHDSTSLLFKFHYVPLQPWWPGHWVAEYMALRGFAEYTPSVQRAYALRSRLSSWTKILGSEFSVEIITQTKKREKEKENKHARKSLGFILYHIPLEEVLSLSLLDILPLLYHTRITISYELKTIVKKWNILSSQTPEISVSKHRLQKSSFHRAFFRLTDLLSAGGRR